MSPNAESARVMESGWERVGQLKGAIHTALIYIEHGLADDAVRVLRAAVEPPRVSVLQCSGVAAVWCPIHGDCTCPDREDLNDIDCPLHSHRSEHAEPLPPNDRSGT